MNRGISFALAPVVLACSVLMTCSSPRPPAATPRDVVTVTTPADPYAGLARLAESARGAFRSDAAMALVRVADQGFRTRGNAAFVAVMDAVERHLVDAGFERSAAPGAAGSARVSRETLTESAPIWDARSASLEVVEPRAEPLLAFDASNDTNRTMLVAFTDGGDVTGELALDAPGANLRGRIVLTDAPADAMAARARSAGVLAVLSAHMRPFNDAARHPDTVRYELLEAPGPRGIPLVNVSPAVASRLRALMARGKVVVRVRADVAAREGRTETLVARVEGRVPNAAPIVVVAHIDEPGANDNGSGVGAMAETIALYARMVRAGAAAMPARPVVFLFGMEVEMSARWVRAHRETSPAFALSVDMVGESSEIAPMLIERTPDPGARRVRLPDEHTAWGAGQAPADWYRGTFLNAYAIAAMGRVEPRWIVRDHPYEGGSDHVPFLARGVPALLFWHFPDDAYHTNRDRLARVSPDEMARVASGVLAMVAHGAAAGERESIELVAINERYALTRLAVETAASRAEITRAANGPARDAVVREESEHVRAWGAWFDEAIASCGRFAVAPTHGFAAASDAARARVRASLERALGVLR